MSGPLLLLGPMSRFMALMQSWSLLMSMAPDTTKGKEDWAVQSSPRSSLTVTLGGLVLPLMACCTQERGACQLGSSTKPTVGKGVKKLALMV